jgi:NAD(P)-dependent dehydrogenase (short-subunit alcohol dehydrogenase family)
VSVEPTIRDKELSAFGLEGKTAVVTGAGSGIGRATAKLLASVGAKVVVSDLDIDSARAVCDEISVIAGSALPVACDVSDAAQVTALFVETLRAFGGTDVLVNNAAYRPKMDFMTMTVAQWDRMHEVNTRGTFLCMQSAIAQMRGHGRGGSIVNISSIGALHPTILKNAHYDSSKAGVNALTRATAMEFAREGIRINAIMPGGVDTEGSRKMRDTGEAATGPMISPDRHLFGRIANPIELARPILFLASPAASFITGAVLAVDGGYLVS